MQQCYEAQQELRGFMREQVAERKADIRAGSSAGSGSETNAFSMLVKASEDEEGKFKLDDSELVSSVLWHRSSRLNQFVRLAMFMLCFSQVTVRSPHGVPCFEQGRSELIPPQQRQLLTLLRRPLASLQYMTIYRKNYISRSSRLLDTSAIR